MAFYLKDKLIAPNAKPTPKNADLLATNATSAFVAKTLPRNSNVVGVTGDASFVDASNYVSASISAVIAAVTPDSADLIGSDGSRMVARSVPVNAYVIGTDADKQFQERAMPISAGTVGTDADGHFVARDVPLSAGVVGTSSYDFVARAMPKDAALVGTSDYNFVSRTMPLSAGAVGVSSGEFVARVMPSSAYLVGTSDYDFAERTLPSAAVIIGTDGDGRFEDHTSSYVGGVVPVHAGPARQFRHDEVDGEEEPSPDDFQRVDVVPWEEDGQQDWGYWYTEGDGPDAYISRGAERVSWSGTTTLDADGHIVGVPNCDIWCRREVNPDDPSDKYSIWTAYLGNTDNFQAFRNHSVFAYLCWPGADTTIQAYINNDCVDPNLIDSPGVNAPHLGKAYSNGTAAVWQMTFPIQTLDFQALQWKVNSWDPPRHVQISIFV